MSIGRAQRRRERGPAVAARFGADAASIALDLLELIELAWHDCHGEVAPPADVMADIFEVSEGTLEGLIVAGHLAVVDWRDLRVNADELRSRK